jgi:hypothetical protein
MFTLVPGDVADSRRDVFSGRFRLQGGPKEVGMRFQYGTRKKKRIQDASRSKPQGRRSDTPARWKQILQLQRMIGNEVVADLFRGGRAAPDGGYPNRPSRQPAANPNQSSFFTPSVQRTVSSEGRPLDPEFRRDAEARFGQDLGAVRVHTGPDAARSAEEIGAAAYTHGEHIAFAPGRYRPNAPEGRRVLAHELAHVLQQRRGGPRPPSPDRGSRLERSADLAASAFVSGRGNVTVAGGAMPGVARIPRSLNQSLNVQMLRDDELAVEIHEIRQWLSANPGASADRTHLQHELAHLEAAAAERPTIVSRGTVVHTGTVGTGASQGTVEARTDEEIAAGGARMGNLLAISYSGADAANARWLQFVWFEMEVVSPSVTGRVSGNIPTTSGTIPFTTDPSAPSWSVDSGPGSPFYVYGGALGIRDANTQALFDRPGGASVAPLFQATLSAVSGATSATFTAHFSTYLLISDVVRYFIPWTAATTATVSGTTATIANVVYAVGSAGTAGNLPANLRTILHTNYPNYTHVR